MKDLEIVKNWTPKSRSILSKKLLITIGIIALIRIGSLLPVPGILTIDLIEYIKLNPTAQEVAIFLAGKETVVFSIFTLGIFPSINASITMQILSNLSPSLIELRKEGDLKSRRSLIRLTRIITIIWAILSSFGIGFSLKSILPYWNLSLLFDTIIWLTTGSMIVLWLSDLITDFGLGNGLSIIICTNIIASFPYYWNNCLIQNSNNINLNLLSVSFCIVLIFISLVIITIVLKAIRRIPVVTAKQLDRQRGRRNLRIKQYIPLKLNQSGILPIIFTTTVLVIPNIIGIDSSGIIFKIFYWITYFVLIVVFSLIYSSIILNPKDIADQLQKAAAIIPGIRPGPNTTFYLKKVIQRITILGSMGLAICTTLPNILEIILNLSSLRGLSASSIIITAGVFLDIGKEITDVIYSNTYSIDYKKKKI